LKNKDYCDTTSYYRKQNKSQSSGANLLRKIIKSQLQFGEVEISEIKFDLRCRDEMPKILMGLQHIYCTPEIREKVFILLEELIPRSVNPNLGRHGMDLWKIFVLGTVRLTCNWDYDKLQDNANNHNTLRQLLGHGIRDEEHHYALQTLRDNISLFTPRILDRVNQIVVKAGHSFKVKKNEEELIGRCDSFVVKTDVHFPTDINLLYDSIRKVMTLLGSLCASHGFSNYRQWKHNLYTVKKHYTKVMRLRYSTSKDPEKKARRLEEIKELHRQYCEVIESHLHTASATMQLFTHHDISTFVMFSEIDKFIKYGHLFIDQIQRRVLFGETIPHNEKVFSIFQPHTEWICKGKAGIPQELGIRVSIVEDQHGFILSHRVMEEELDSQAALPLMKATKEKFPTLVSCSFDKGYYTPENKRALAEYLSVVAMRKKGRPSKADLLYESSQEFMDAHKGHAAVESGIHSLVNHGLDRCLDHGIEGFKRYVALAVVAQNLKNLGNLLQKKELKRQKRKEKIKNTLTWKRYATAA